MSGELDAGGPEETFVKTGFDFGFCELIWGLFVGWKRSAAAWNREKM